MSDEVKPPENELIKDNQAKITAKTCWLVEKLAINVIKNKDLTDSDKEMVESIIRSVPKYLEEKINTLVGNERVKKVFGKYFAKIKTRELEGPLASKIKVLQKFNPIADWVQFFVCDNKMWRYDEDGIAHPLTDWGVMLVETVLIGKNGEQSYVGTIQNNDTKINFELPASYWWDNPSRLTSAIKAIAGDNISPCIGADKFIIKASQDIIKNKSTKKVCDFGLDENMESYFCGDYMITKDGVTKDVGNRYLPTTMYGRRIKLTPIEDKAKLNEVLVHIRDDLMTFNSEKIMSFALGLIFLSPLKNILMGLKAISNNMAPSVIITGRTGVGKSAMLACCQKFFGPFPDKDICNWNTATPKSITAILSTYNSSAGFVDDLKYSSYPLHKQNEINSFYQSFADGAGVDRLKRGKDNSFEPIHGEEVKCCLLTAAEDIPSSEQSIISRHLIINMDASDHVDDMPKYSRCRNNSQYYTGVMVDYIQWLLNKENLRDYIFDKIQKYSDEISKDLTSEVRINSIRVCMQLSENHVGWGLFIQYLCDKDILTKEEAVAKINQHLEYCKSIRSNRFSDIVDENPAEKFVETINQLLGSKQVIIEGAPFSSEDPDKKFDRARIIGHYEKAENIIYLYPKVSVKIVQETLANERIPFTTKAIGQSLDDYGYLIKKTPGKKTFFKRCKGISTKFYVFDASVFGIEKEIPIIADSANTTSTTIIAPINFEEATTNTDQLFGNS